MIADLLHPQSLVASNELVAVLLTDPENEVAEALTLFDHAQLEAICDEAGKLLEEAGLLADYEQRLSLLQNACLPLELPLPASVQAKGRVSCLLHATQVRVLSAQFIVSGKLHGTADDDPVMIVGHVFHIRVSAVEIIQ